MGSNDISPPHVYPYTVRVAGILLQIGGLLWTITYVLLARESFLSKSYGMPLLAICSNLGWELVYTFYVVEQRFEQFAFGCWLFIDIFVVYGFLKFGGNEWSHSSFMKRNLANVLTVGTVWFTLLHWAAAKKWLDEGIGMKEGHWYFGIEGVDTTELGFWSASLPQTILCLASLVQLVTRQHTGGVSWAIWTTRFLGTLIGLHAYYAWMWYMWREAHEYFMSPIGIVLWGTALGSDLVYAFVFASIRKTEKVLPDGRRVAGTGDEKITDKKN